MVLLQYMPTVVHAFDMVGRPDGGWKGSMKTPQTGAKSCLL
jgi:hypothetical protein